MLDGSVGNDEQSLTSFLRLIQEESSPSSKLEHFKTVISVIPKYTENSTEFNFYLIILDELKNLINQFLEENLNTSKDKTVNDVPNCLRTNLSNCIATLNILDTLLENINDNEAVQVQNLVVIPYNTIHILISVFSHCKTSKETYKKYFEGITEIISLFKKAQDVHLKLLIIFEKHLCVTLNDNDEVTLFLDVLNIFCEMGNILSGMNIKSAATNWKCYLGLLQKYNTVLKRSDFVPPLELLISEISSNLDSVINSELDVKNTAQLLKLSTFLLKIIIKLFEMFNKKLQKSFRNTLSLLIYLNRIHPSYLVYRNFSKEIVDLVDQDIFTCYQCLLTTCVNETDFFELLSDKNILQSVVAESGIWFLYFAVDVLLAISSPETAEVRKIFKFCNFFDVILTTMGSCYTELFWNIIYSNTVLYDHLLTAVISAISCYNFQQRKLEIILLKHVLKQDVWSAVFATDVWYICAKGANGCQQYDNLSWLINKTENALKTNFCRRIEFVHLEFLIKRLYSALSDKDKMQFVNRYPLVESNLYIWRIIGLKNFPVSFSFSLEDLLRKAYDCFKKIQFESFSIADFIKMCLILEVLSTVNIPKSDTKTDQFICQLMMLWEFDHNNITLLTNNLFKIFIEKLLKCTQHFILRLNSEQLFLVLIQVSQHLIVSSSIKLLTLKLLSTMFYKTLPNSPQKSSIQITISKIYNVLLKDENPIIRQKTLESLVNFVDIICQDVNSSTENIMALHEAVSKYLKNVEESCSPQDLYLESMKNIQYKHRCLEWSSIIVPQQKKFKSDQDEVEMNLQKIQEHVAYLKVVCGDRILNTKNIDVVKEIISDMQTLI